MKFANSLTNSIENMLADVLKVYFLNFTVVISLISVSVDKCKGKKA